MTTTLDDAITAFQQRRFQEARQALEGICETEPSNDRAQFFLAKSMLALGQKDEAVEALKRLSQSANLRVADMANEELSALDSSQQAAPIFYCPQCTRALASDRAADASCECGWGRKRESGQVLYVAHVMTMVRKRQAPPIEINVGGDFYEIGAEVSVKHMSVRRSAVDPRAVFPVMEGQPVLTKKDLGLVIPHQDKQAVFRESRGMGRLFSWDAYMENLRKIAPYSQQAPDNGLRAMLVNYGGMSDAQLTLVEQHLEDQTLGQALINIGTCTLDDMLIASLGPSRFYKPTHHHDNQVGYLLLRAGAISEAQLADAISTQLRNNQPLAKILASQVEPGARSQAARALKDQPLVGPESDGIGEVLCAMGRLSRTALAHGLREQQEQNRHLGQVLLDGGHISQDQLFEAVKRQELKRSLRMGLEVRLGDILMRQGACAISDIEWALHAQIQQARPLGELLVNAGVCSPEQIIAGVMEQEERLEVLVDRRLSSVLQDAKERAKAYAPKMPPRQAPRRSVEVKKAVHRPSPLLNGLTWAGGILIVGISLGVFANGVANSSLFKRLQPPVVKAFANSSKTAPMAPALSKMYSNPTVKVDTDDVIKRIENDDPNPLGEGYIGAYKKPVPSAFETASRQVGKPGATATAPGTPGVGGPGGPASAPANKPTAGFEQAPTYVSRMLEEDLDLDQANVETASGVAGRAAIEGDQLMVLERPKEAAVAYRQALSETAGDPGLLVKTARAERLGGHPDVANATLVRALKAGDDPATLNEVGSTLLRGGKTDQAVKYFRSASERAPDQVAYAHNLGVALARRGDVAGAKAAFKESLALDPRRPSTHYQLGLLLTSSDHKTARKHLMKAQEGFSGQVESRIAYSDAMKASGDAIESVRALEEGLRLNTQLAQTYLALGKVAVAEENYKEATQHFTQAKVTFQSNAIAHTRLGDAFYALKQPKSALKEWCLANQIAPNDPSPIYKLGLLAKAQGRLAEARQFFDAAKQRDPNGTITRGIGLNIQ